MENEKKQNDAPRGEHQGAKKHHRPRHKHGYFIDPNAPKKEQGAPAASTPKETQKSAPASEAQKNAPTGNAQAPANAAEGQVKKKRHRKRHSNQNRPKPETEAGAPVQNENPSADNTPVKSAERHNNSRRDRSQKKEQEAPRQESAQKSHTSDRLVRPQNQRPVFDPATEEEYEEVRFPASEEADVAVAAEQEEEPAVMVEVVGIRFKSTGKVYYFAPNQKTLKKGDSAIVETARGQEFGEVAIGNTMVKESDTVPPLRPVLRVATEADRVHHAENKKKEEDSFRICNEKIQAHGLDMKLIDAQYTFDNSKLLFYFTSAGRVDFRDLVKDLASVFRTRIELRQIGIRDEAKLMGGMGMCGRPLCCTLFLSDFGQVSIKMAKEQNLSLNSAKISGICGRLMCCLRYEHEAYEYEIKRTPPVDSLVKTVEGTGTVTEINPLVGTIKVRLHAAPDTPPKTFRREDVIMLRKKNDKSEKDQKSDKKEK